MSSFDSDIRARFERATAGIEPSVTSRTATLRRARRKRTMNAVVSGGLAAVAIVTAVFVTNVVGGPSRDGIPASGTGEVRVPSGHVEISTAPIWADEAWALSWAAVDGCLALTTSEAHSEFCASPKRVVNVLRADHQGTTFVFGDVSEEVKSVHLQVSGQQDTIFAGLHRAPQAVPGDRGYFAIPLPTGSHPQTLFAYRTDGDVEAVMLNGGVAAGAINSIRCITTSKLDARVEALRTKVRESSGDTAPSPDRVRHAGAGC